MKQLFIGDIIASQIANIYSSSGYDEVDVIYRTNTLYLPKMSALEDSFPLYDQVWYCVGYGDLLTLKYCNLLDFGSIISSQIDSILENGAKELIIVVPVLPTRYSVETRQFIQQLLIEESNNYLTSVYLLDLNDIISDEYITDINGLNEQGISLIKDFLIGSIEF